MQSADDVRLDMLHDGIASFVRSATDDAKRKFAHACAKLAVERAFAGDTSNEKAVLRQALATGLLHQRLYVAGCRFASSATAASPTAATDSYA
ncbi:MAG TPA: hypothetical protein VF814_00105, partial [Casimicrobiaceae bacterium]